MSSGKYIPARGDIIWVDFSPTRGNEQSGKRPALVLSPLNFNSKYKLVLACPITSQIKQLPFEVLLDGKIKGVVLCHQIRSISYPTRMIDYAETVSDKVITEVAHKIDLLMP